MGNAVRAGGIALGAAAAVGAGALAWGVFVERTRWTVRREVVPVLPPGSRSITVLHFSDLHMAPWQEGKQEFIRSLVRYEPDLIVDTGDDLGHVDGIDGIEAAYAPFRGVQGVFAHGSNDYVGPLFKNPLAYLARASKAPGKRGVRLDTARLDRFLGDDLGWLDLGNHARAIEIRGTRLELFGTADAHHRRDDVPAMQRELATMRREVRWSEDTGDEVVRIGVTHAPYRKILDALVDEGAGLVFAGHTHGGQVRIPGMPALTANCDLPREQASGLSQWMHGDRIAYLEVSAGLGTSIYAPVRFACPPEAIVLTLVPRSA
jgi:predicted MPP superfamily phosphohydrolase